MKKLTLLFAAMMAVMFGANAQGIIRLDAFQIMYAGIDNPITVAASGYDSKNLSIRVADTVATFKAGKGVGAYTIRPRPGVTKLTIDIVAKTKKGKMETVGRQTFVIRDIPAPTLRINGIESGGKINKKEVTANTTVIPFKDLNFLLKIDNKMIRIVKMIVSVGAKEENVTGPRFNETIASMIRRASVGERLNIVAEVMMPDGKTKSVTAIYTITGKETYYEPAVDENGNPIVDKNGNPLFREYEYKYVDEEDYDDEEEDVVDE